MFKIHDINKGLKDFETTQNAVLLDVRTPEEYRMGHIPNSKNVPLDSIHDVSKVVNDKNIPVFVYCHSGARSAQASSLLKRMGYTDIRNIGGIASYTGKVVR